VVILGCLVKAIFMPGKSGFKVRLNSFWIWWHTIVILALERLRKENLKFEPSLGYISIPYLKKMQQPRAFGKNQWTKVGKKINKERPQINVYNTQPTQKYDPP
jgi:hypothetical protein